jgi:glycerophosphoryl diester phosphodiesterase
MPAYGKTQIIAHRGASRERPENTLAAFVRAVELGADGIELDVHLTADGVLVVHHDAVPHDPPSPPLAKRDLRTLTLGELAAFQVQGEPIPTLAAVLDAIPKHLTVYCELKGAGTAPEAVRLLANRSAASVHAFDHRQVAEAGRLAPALSRGVLEASYHIDPTASLRSVNARDLWQAAELIDRPLIEAVHALGGRVIAWTVDDPDVMRHLAELGTDGLCTNDVALCRETVGR